MLLLIKLMIDIICGLLNSLGGWRFLWMRRYIMPLVIGVTASFLTGVWWCGLLTLPAMGTLCLGYFSGKNWGRALWLFVQATALSIGLFATHHLLFWIFFPYLIGAGILGGMYKNWYQPLGDFIAGIYLSLFIWGLHG